MPILDSSQPSKGIMMVNIQNTALKLMTKCSQYNKVFVTIICCRLQVNFVKEGCGSDHICQSNVKMEYKLYYKQNNLDVYSPLPT